MTGGQTTTLSHILADRGMTGKALAHAIGATESQVSHYRNGLRPSPIRAKQMSDALAMTVDEIRALGWDTEVAQ